MFTGANGLWILPHGHLVSTGSVAFNGQLVAADLHPGGEGDEDLAACKGNQHPVSVVQ